MCTMHIEKDEIRENKRRTMAKFMHALILRCCISHLIPNRNLLHSLRSFHCRQQHHHHHHSCALNRINSSHMHIKYTFFVRTKCTLRIHVRRTSHVSGACRSLCVCVCAFANSSKSGSAQRETIL